MEMDDDTSGLSRKPRPGMSALLDRSEAAAYLRVGLSAFKEHVQPEVPNIRIGARVLFRQEDLDAWVDRQRAGASNGNAGGPTSTSPGRATLTALPSGRGTAERLRRPPRVRTPKSSPVGDGRSGTSRAGSSTSRNS